MVNNIYNSNIDQRGALVNQKLHELSVSMYELSISPFWGPNWILFFINSSVLEAVHEPLLCFYRLDY